jgi:hypothetical protein
VSASTVFTLGCIGAIAILALEGWLCRWPLVDWPFLPRQRQAAERAAHIRPLPRFLLAGSRWACAGVTGAALVCWWGALGA